MALIKCPECGKEISDKANVCIQCGCPLTYFSAPQKTTVENSIILSTENKKNIFFRILTVFNILAFLFFNIMLFIIYMNDSKHGIDVSWGKVSIAYADYYDNFFHFFFGELADFSFENGVNLMCILTFLFFVFFILNLLAKILIFNSSFVFSNGKIVGKAIFNKKANIGISEIKKVSSACFSGIVIHTSNEKFHFANIKNRKEILNYLGSQLIK